jgi:hypothetical protein
VSARASRRGLIIAAIVAGAALVIGTVALVALGASQSAIPAVQVGSQMSRLPVLADT